MANSRHMLALLPLLACASFASAQLALVPPDGELWSRGLQTCDVVWTDDDSAPPTALQYELVYDPLAVRVARVDRGYQALFPYFSGPPDLEARVDDIGPGRTRVTSAPALSASSIHHRFTLDILAGGGEVITINIENLTAIGGVGDDFAVLAPTFPSLDFEVVQDIDALALPSLMDGIVVREGSFLTVAPLTDRNGLGLSCRLALSAESGLLWPASLTHAGAADAPPVQNWTTGEAVDTFSALFATGVVGASTGAGNLPLARFHVIGSGPSNSMLTLSLSDQHAGPPSFQSIASIDLQVPMTILPARSALVKISGPSSTEWIVDQQVELIASLNIPAGSTPGLLRAHFETNPEQLRIDSVELMDDAPWFAELFATTPDEVTATGQLTLVTLLDAQGEVENTSPSSGGYIPVFRITATVLSPASDGAIMLTLKDATERSPWGEDLVLVKGPTVSWSLVPPAVPFDMISVQ